MGKSIPGEPRYRELVAWQCAIDLAELTYRLTAAYLATERFGLVQQMRRAAVSGMSNIAEGNFRLHIGDYIHHVSIARGSIGELRAQLELSGRLGFIEGAALHDALASCDRVGRLMTGLAGALRARQTKHQSRIVD
jgi:four helix bundle protein